MCVPDRGTGAKSKEKLLVFAYALAAMELPNKAALASRAVHNKTGLEVKIDHTIPQDANNSRERTA